MKVKVNWKNCNNCQKTFNVHIDFCSVKNRWFIASCAKVWNQQMYIDSSLQEKTQSLFHIHNHRLNCKIRIVDGCLRIKWSLSQQHKIYVLLATIFHPRTETSTNSGNIVIIKYMYKHTIILYFACTFTNTIVMNMISKENKNARQIPMDIDFDVYELPTINRLSSKHR